MKASLDEVLGRTPGAKTQEWPSGEPFAAALKHGSMLLEAFAPRGIDRQTPHDQDEIYIIAAGTAILEVAGKQTASKAGDALFVAARVEHRFHQMSEDFVTWVVLWGPVGGES